MSSTLKYNAKLNESSQFCLFQHQPMCNIASNLIRTTNFCNTLVPFHSRIANRGGKLKRSIRIEWWRLQRLGKMRMKAKNICQSKQYHYKILIFFSYFAPFSIKITSTTNNFIQTMILSWRSSLNLTNHWLLPFLTAHTMNIIKNKMLQIWSTQIVMLQRAKTQSEATILHCHTLCYVLKKAAVSCCAWCQPWRGECHPISHGWDLPKVIMLTCCNMDQRFFCIYSSVNYMSEQNCNKLAFKLILYLALFYYHQYYQWYLTITNNTCDSQLSQIIPEIVNYHK